ncbi:MAG TPA: NrfD/PsrC family molybdoenzyme membrane anchor subunit [Dissulfurispiraceae bacterium]|nr:NrfD/PsrC family molybdoenzyme membrane anchor subunit [Dissulfurispiraceae bacterium]
MAEDVTKTAEAAIVAGGWAGVRAGVLQALQGSKGYYAALIISGMLFLAAVAAGLHAKYIGTMHAYGASREVPWGILISTYVFFVVTSTGLCLVSSIGHVFGVKDFMPIAKRSVFLSIMTIVAGFFVIAFEIENPLRMAVYNVISPNLTSNIWWMGTLYGAYLFFMAVEFTFLVMNKPRIATAMGFMGVISGIAAHSNLGAVFGMLHGREFWYGPYMPIYFIASAMMSGAATIIFFTWLAYKTNGERMDATMKRALEVTTKVGILLISTILFFTAWKFITGFVGGEGKTAALDLLLTGSYAFNFWVLEVAVGMVIPLALFIVSRGQNLKLIATASALMIFGIFFMRYDLVIVGQLVPVYYELGVNEYTQLLSYAPSAHEIVIVLGGLAFVGLTFLLGEKIFSGHKSEIH